MEHQRIRNEDAIYEHTVEFEKGIKTSIMVSTYDDHHTKDTLFGITDIFLHNMPNESEDPAITVYGGFRKPYEHIGKDPISGDRRPLYFVIGDVLVPAECLDEYMYQGLLVPNLPGEVEFFVSLNGITPVSQVMKLTFPNTKKSQIRTELEEKLATLLVTNDKARKKLMRELKKCDDEKTHSERILREYIKDWLFDNCRLVNAVDRQALQIIHLLANLGYAWAIAIFKRFGFSFSCQDENGWSPLHCAAYYGRKGAVTALLIGRADPSLVTTPTANYPNGCTAGDIAFQQRHYYLAAYLKEFIEHPEKREETLFIHPSKRARLEG